MWCQCEPSCWSCLRMRVSGTAWSPPSQSSSWRPPSTPLPPSRTASYLCCELLLKTDKDQDTDDNTKPVRSASVCDSSLDSAGSDGTCVVHHYTKQHSEHWTPNQHSSPPSLHVGCFVRIQAVWDITPRSPLHKHYTRINTDSRKYLLRTCSEGFSN